MFDQVIHDFLGNRGGSGEADALPAAVRRKDGGVDADQVAAGINQRAAGVAPVNRRIGLDKVLEGGDAQVAAAGGTDDAHGHGLAHTQRVADGQYHIAHLHRAVAVQFHFGQRFQGDMQERQVGFRVCAHYPGGGITAITQGHQNFIRIADDVITGQHIAAVVDDYPGAQAAQGAFTAGLLHKAVEQRVFSHVLVGDDLGGVDVHHRRGRMVHRTGIAGNAGVVLCGLGVGSPLVPPQGDKADGQAGNHRAGQKTKQFDHR